MKTIRPLNFMPYNRAEAISKLVEKVGFKEYGRKHGESVFTRFYQNYYLPRKFGFDKRLPHFSTLILTNQMTREEALEQLKQPLYENELSLKYDINFFCRKLGISEEEFENIMNSTPHPHTDYPTWDVYYKLIKKIQGLFEKVANKRIRNYS